MIKNFLAKIFNGAEDLIDKNNLKTNEISEINAQTNINQENQMPPKEKSVIKQCEEVLKANPNEELQKFYDNKMKFYDKASDEAKKQIEADLASKFSILVKKDK